MLSRNEIHQFRLLVAGRLWFCAVAGIVLLASAAQAHSDAMLIDGFSGATLSSPLGTRWRVVSDQVMGGVSTATISLDTIDGRRCVRLRGDVRLDNNGGFVQASLDLAPESAALDASEYTGIRLVVRGNGEDYSVHLRTPDNVRP